LDPADLAELHQPIFDAIVAGDGEAAAREMRSHIEHFGELLQRESHLATNKPASSTSPVP
jgi:DNA-binding FadR family transcriptional regulator